MVEESEMTKSKIEWTEEVWNPVTGCTPVSEGCQNCYAKRMASRLRGRFGYDKEDPFMVTTHIDRLHEPETNLKPTRYFVCSMGDLFHPLVPYTFRWAVFRVMIKIKRHNYLVLTKRPIEAAEFIQGYDELRHLDKIAPHVWIGVSAESQWEAYRRVPILLDIPAAKHFVSIEPMLGPVRVVGPLIAVDWIICGGETGPGARKLLSDWPNDLRKDCAKHSIPFFFKQWNRKGDNELDGKIYQEICR